MRNFDERRDEVFARAEKMRIQRKARVRVALTVSFVVAVLAAGALSLVFALRAGDPPEVPVGTTPASSGETDGRPTPTTEDSTCAPNTQTEKDLPSGEGGYNGYSPTPSPGSSEPPVTPSPKAPTPTPTYTPTETPTETPIETSDGLTTTPTETPTPERPTPTETPTHAYIEPEPPLFTHYNRQPVLVVKIGEKVPEQKYSEREFEAYYFEVISTREGKIVQDGGEPVYKEFSELLRDVPFLLLSEELAQTLKSGDTIFTFSFGLLGRLYIYDAIPVVEGRLRIDETYSSYSAHPLLSDFYDINMEIRGFQSEKTRLEQTPEDEKSEETKLCERFFADAYACLPEKGLVDGATLEEIDAVFDWLNVVTRCHSDYMNYLWNNGVLIEI